MTFQIKLYSFLKLQEFKVSDPFVNWYDSSKLYILERWKFER